MALGVTLLIVACIISGLFSLPFYRDKIPNGHYVPNPCKTPQTWDAVGHYNPVHHTLAKNQFAKDFQDNGHKWTTTLCKMDSDKDNKTNGEELGDPNCTWVEGAKPFTNAFGHPGICEPLDSHHCIRLQHVRCSCLEHCHGIVNSIPPH